MFKTVRNYWSIYIAPVIKTNLIGIGIIVFLVSGISYLSINHSNDKIIRREEIRGTLQGIHFAARSPNNIAGVRLESGVLVSVKFSRDIPYKNGAAVILLKEETAKGYETYRFLSYAEDIKN